MQSSREIRERLRASLATAIKTRDTVAVSALRSALSAIANAEAVRPAGGSKLSRLGIGAADVPRRELSAGEVVDIIRGEIAERSAAASEMDRLGNAEHADRLHAEAAVLTGAIDS